MAEHNQKGIQGEILAQKYLLQQGYLILHTNWRFENKEIDIIAQKGKIIAVVEVKMRSSAYFGEPEEFVDTKKQRFLIEAAEAFMQTVNEELEVRFDIISVVKNSLEEKLKHIEDAFEAFLD